MRFIAARLRHLVGDRRSAPRRETRLRCTVSLVDGRNGVSSARRTATLEGYTCDVSASGLGLVLPAIRIGERYLTGEGRTLLIQLELPHSDTLRMRCVAVRYERLEEGETRIGYLVGVRITEIGEAERKSFTAYLADRTESLWRLTTEL